MGHDSIQKAKSIMSAWHGSVWIAGSHWHIVAWELLPLFDKYQRVFKEYQCTIKGTIGKQIIKLSYYNHTSTNLVIYVHTSRFPWPVSPLICVEKWDCGAYTIKYGATYRMIMHNGSRFKMVGHHCPKWPYHDRTKNTNEVLGLLEYFLS